MQTEKIVQPIPTGPTWAKGCPECRNGLINPPALTGNGSLYQERITQFDNGLLTFCQCNAGESQRRSLSRQSIDESATNAEFVANFNREGAGV